MITEATDQLIRLALAEDVGTGDRTTLATIGEATPCSAHVVAKEPLVSPSRKPSHRLAHEHKQY